MAEQCDLVLVIGSKNSSNSNRLVDVARDHGAASYLIDNETEVREEWLEGVRVVGISSGASAPEGLVSRLVDFFRARGTQDVAEFEVLREDVRFMLPKTIRQQLAATALSHARSSAPCSSSFGGGRADRGALAVEPQRRRGQRVAGELRGRAPSRATAASAKASATSLIGPAGTAAARSVVDPVRGGSGARGPARAARASSSACATRALFVAKRSSAGRSGSAERRAEPREEAVVADRDGDRAVGGSRRSRTA